MIVNLVCPVTVHFFVSTLQTMGSLPDGDISKGFKMLHLAGEKVKSIRLQQKVR